MRFLQSKLFACLFGAMLFLLTTAFLTTSGLGPAPTASDFGALNSEFGAMTKGPSWAFFNPEMDQIISELRAERDAVDLRNRQLDEMAARLKAERAELEQGLRRIQKLQQQVDRDIFRIREDEAGNLKKLTKMYAAMDPGDAAKILREMDDIVVVKIMNLMKDPEASAILESFSRLGAAETKRVASISESLRSAAPARSNASK
jgi:flagellar motility protein MotE (MotC chaperone)